METDDIIERAVNQLSLVSAAMKMLLENCERALLDAAESADPGPEPIPVVALHGAAHGSGRRLSQARRQRLRAR